MSTFMFIISIIFMILSIFALLFNAMFSIAFGILSLLFAKYSEQIEKDKKSNS